MNSQVLKRLLAYLKNYKGRFTFSVVATCLGTLFMVIAPRPLGDITTVLYAGIVDHLWFIEDLPDGTVNPDSVWVRGHSDDSRHAARLWAGDEARRNELRKHFGMVLQDTWLFEGTIRDNLKYSTTREVSDEEMEKATKSVCADAFIHTMPGGYDMVLSKGAENISQGQRQLLTIARAIIADLEVMILDQATSNVDAHTEQAIQNAMAVLLKGRTSFVIAHRLSTIRDADVILYMEDGDIKEVGDHDTLMKMGGKYTALYYSQFG